MPRPSVAYVAVGSNIQPELHIPLALESLSNHARITGISKFYRTRPVGRTGQPDYCNGVVRIETWTAPLAFKMQVLREVEDRAGRIRNDDKYAPRTIDLDLVLYDDLILCTQNLELPDPDIFERAFVSVPLAELAPDVILPGTGRRIADLADAAGLDGMEVLRDFTRHLREYFLREAHPTNENRTT